MQELNEYFKNISLKDLEEEVLSESDIIERANSATGFYNHHFKNILAKMIFKKTKEMGITAETEKQIIYYRGIFKSLSDIDDWFKEQKSISIGKIQESISDKENI